MEWIRTAKLLEYNVIDAFDSLKVLDWKKGNYKIDKGDIVYIYVGVPFSRIMYKTECIKVNIYDDEVIDDRKYYVNQNEFYSGKERIRLKLISTIDDERLSLDTLSNLGLVENRIQGAYKSINYPSLFEYVNQIFNENQTDMINEYSELKNIVDNLPLDSTEKSSIVKQRIGQGKYRDKLIHKFGCKCVLCGLTNKNLLIASHIKELSDSTDYERLDEDNGLLLCTLHDSLFDKHLISFDSNGKIIVSSQLSPKDLSILGLNRYPSIKLNNQMKKYMKVHRSKLI